MKMKGNVMKQKTLNEMTRKDFEAVPDRKWDRDIGTFNSLIILPTRLKHDSGYRCMDFVACDDDKPIARLSGCSDVLHVGGISAETHPGRLVVWSIDCLRTSGLPRLFVPGGEMTAGPALSDFEVFPVGKQTGKKK